MSLRPSRRLRQALLWAGAAALIAALGAWAGERARRGSLDDSAAAAREQLRAHAEALQAVIERYRTLPAVLALDPEVRAALAAPAAAAVDTDALNRKLEAVNGAAATSTLTLLDRRGRSIAASNWRSAHSNVGVAYGFRPYFQQAVEQGRGAFYALGVTTGVPGYFLSQSVRGDDGAVIGVMVVKLGFDEAQSAWREQPGTVLVSDAHGIVFMASDPAWRYRDLRPLRADERRELARTRQYGDVPSNVLASRTLARVAPDARHVRLPGRPDVLWSARALPEQGWTLHLLSAAAPSAAAAAGRRQALTVAATLAAAALLWLLVAQRRRLARLRERSRLELQQLVEQHAVELRTAQHALVQAASGADYGESPSLQHLPQGVCVIDRGLRLVAWNRRYVELFGFPAGLVEVGRPIEEIFRFNARRGLLGPGPVEEAIARRLEHLRAGKPHMHERERGDGVVIEIRGNPLPDGGFVTSYADITSYKTAARELRSLADALEGRVAERTRDLDAARREAERANQSKTRFVAAVVHDLLQPLNAARMFVSVLQSRPGDHQARDTLDRVEGALSAQEAILASLLDISRLESGAFDTRVEAIALEPLLDALAREFDLLAQAKGVRLRHPPTRLAVRSDRALLRRIVQNFVSNAVRYTARGGVLLGCRRDGDGVWIEVHDTGPGIPEALQGEIFEEFRRLDSGVAGDRGAGLGLAIVERIARVLDHPIRLRSRLGRGSVFAVRVPLAAAPVGVPPPAPAPAEAAVARADDAGLAGARVWCVDDDPRVCEASRALLERWRCAVEFAGGADEALAAARPGEAPRFVLLDVRLGETTGPDLLPALQARWRGQDAAARAACDVILITAERDDAIRSLARQHGWGYLPKPVKPAALRAWMSQCLRRGG